MATQPDDVSHRTSRPPEQSTNTDDYVAFSSVWMCLNFQDWFHSISYIYINEKTARKWIIISEVYIFELPKTERTEMTYSLGEFFAIYFETCRPMNLIKTVS